MPVAYMEGDVFHGLRQGTWEVGEVKYCQRGQFEADPLMLCGGVVQVAWAVLLTKESGNDGAAEAHDLRRTIYAGAKTFDTRQRHGDWKTAKCEREAEGLDCD
jgi:hypothetical protein